jgi:uncharacterized membrane protein HdeD (DUF308 family)
MSIAAVIVGISWILCGILGVVLTAIESSTNCHCPENTLSLYHDGCIGINNGTVYRLNYICSPALPGYITGLVFLSIFCICALFGVLFLLVGECIKRTRTSQHEQPTEPIQLVQLSENEQAAIV